MAIFLKAAEFIDLCQQSQMESSSNQTGLDRSTLLPRSLGQGTYRQVCLRGGLTIEIREGFCNKPSGLSRLMSLFFP